MAGSTDHRLTSLAVLLRRWREREMLTQEQLAARTGLGTRTIRRLESVGPRRPHGQSLRLIADALALTDAERNQLADAARGDATRPGTPRQLPAAPAGFTGRVNYLRRLDALLTGVTGPGTVVISAIAGTAGIGKTALAVHWAHRTADRFPDGQLYVNLRGFDQAGTPTPPETAIRGFLDALAVPAPRIPADLDAQCALYRSLLADRRMLILLDNAIDAEQVRPLLTGGANCVTLVTSRNPLAGLVATEGARALSLDLLSTSESRELLLHRLGVERATAEPGALDEIIDQCAGLPLALAIAAARATTEPDRGLPDLAAELRGGERRLDALSTGDLRADIRQVFSWSYDGLSPGAARMFRLVGLHPGPDLSLAAAASLAGKTPREVRALLRDLTQANLLTESSPGRYSCHDLLRAYATGLVQDLDSGPDRHAAIGRMLDHYVHSACAADRLLDPGRDPVPLPSPAPGVSPEQPADPDQALAWLTAESAVLVSAVAYAATARYDAHSWRLAWALRTFLDRRGLWHDWLATAEMAVAATRRLGDGSMQGNAHRLLAGAYLALGRIDDARTALYRALGAYEVIGNPAGLAHTHLTLARLYAQQDDFAGAGDHAQQALQGFQVADHIYVQAGSLNNLGWYTAQRGDHRQAIVLCERALKLFQEIGNAGGQASSWDSLGYAYHRLGDLSQAIACYERAVTFQETAGDLHYQAEHLSHLGDAHLANRDRPAARDAWQRALAILRELDHPDVEPLERRLKESQPR